MSRLSLATLRDVGSGVERAGTRPRRVGIVHIGLGAFHRAHQALYTDEVDNDGFGICALSLKTPRARDALAPQDGLYTVVEKSRAGTRRRVVGSIVEARFLGDERHEIHQRLLAPETAIVSLTITEKGYAHDPASGGLNFAHPEIVHDVADPEHPQGAIGLIVAALDARRRSHGRPFTVLTCDNLPHNGPLVRGLVVAFAQHRDDSLARWIESNASFPATMVDRIVPATTPADVEANDAALGVHDAGVVVCEPFRQWVIEDDFVAGRPPWERAGAQLVDDVAPFEAMKLRLLNASHSAFAYLGYLAGHEFIYQVAAVPAFVAYMRALMNEVSPTLAVPPGTDLAAYRDALVERFGNPALPHKTRQIAMDGSQKLPQRLLATVRDNLAAGRPIGALALALAGWMRYACGVDESGRPIDVQDPLAREFARIAHENARNPAALVHGFTALSQIFGDDLPLDPRFVDAVTNALRDLFAHGAAATVAQGSDSIYKSTIGR
jgi:fructuronate reductase